MAPRKTTPDSTDLLEIIKQLQDEIKSMKSNSGQVYTYQEEDEDEPIDIPITKQIKVVSLYNGGLTLFTQAHGTGKPYRFNTFGATRTISYGDLIDCIAHQTRYFNDGYVMILDKDVNKVQGFEEVVKSLLTKKQVETILEQDVSNIKIMLKNTTKNILETVVENITFALVEGQDLDMNKVKAVSDIYGKDITEIANTLKEAR